jgi:4'-phosphopantetheinyl transferase
MTVPKCCWQIPRTSLILSSNDVHLWRAKLDQSNECVKQLTQMLSDEEQRKTERFHFDKDRKRFIVSHGVLRTILSRYLDVEPNRLRFGYRSHGKPYLVEKLNGEEVCFNLSHSHSMSLYAFTRSRQIGVDIEYIHPITEADQIVARFFSSNEHAMWQQLPKGQKQEAFFNCWTRKEAYIKARGEGLSLPLDQFDMSFDPDKPPALSVTRGASDESSRWLLRVLQTDPGYVAALVVEGYDWQLKCWEWRF